jgi:hypothetical protein
MLHCASGSSRTTLSENVTPIEERKDPPSPIFRRWKGDMVELTFNTASFDESPGMLEKRSVKSHQRIDKDVLGQVFESQSRDHALRFLALMEVDYEEECRALESLRESSEEAFRRGVLIRYKDKVVAILDGEIFEAFKLFYKTYEALPSDVLETLLRGV